MTSTQPEEQTLPLAYQVGVFALIHHQGAYLIVQPRQPLLPGGGQGLPGVLLSVGSGLNLVEMNLRRVVREQVKLVVSDLKLVGSHASRGPLDSRADARLNLIFGTEYSAGILNVDPAHLVSADWLPRAEVLAPGKFPEWLQGAVREFETVAQAPAAPEPTPARGLRFGRRR